MIFEEIKRIDENGVEYWTARELFPLLGYSRWETFEDVINRAKRTALNSGQIIENHFRELTKIAEVGSNKNKREIKDWKLDRYACYLIAQNGDSKIQQIALAQTYFAIQTRKQELFEQSSEIDKRIMIRGEVSSENKKLFKTAKKAGVSNFGLFNDAGYKGLYGMPLGDIEKRKGIKKGGLLDHAGATELAANLFRITQTDEKLKKDNIQNEIDARKTHNMVGGKVRQTIKNIGGTLPENLKPEKHIKEVKKDVRLVKKQKKLK
ncbi:MAG: DNA damage-inducible protein D [Candidatus Paceibacterota bacterium]|jgi:DNA-damage-inducible protein D